MYAWESHIWDPTDKGATYRAYLRDVVAASRWWSTLAVLSYVPTEARENHVTDGHDRSE